MAADTDAGPSASDVKQQIGRLIRTLCSVMHTLDDVPADVSPWEGGPKILHESCILPC